MLRRPRLSKRVFRRALMLAVAALLATAGLAFALTGLQNASFESGLDFWSAKTVKDSAYGTPEVVHEGQKCDSQNGVCVIEGQDSFTVQDDVYGSSGGSNRTVTVSPNDGNKMVRLGGPFNNAGQTQESDVHPQISQTFSVDPSNTVLQLNFNVFTFDYEGFDKLNFDVKLTDESGQTISQFDQGAFGPGGDTSFKSTGWQPAYIDLAGYEGQQVQVHISSGGTSDSLYGFWAYIDAGMVQQRPVGNPQPQPVTDPATGQPVDYGSYENPNTGLSYITIPSSVVNNPSGFNGCLNLPVKFPINPGSGSVSNVKLILDPKDGSPDKVVNASDADSNGVWDATIPCAETGDLFVQYELTEGGSSQQFIIPIGGLTLIDPQGVVYDKQQFDAAKAAGKSDAQARSDAAIQGASVLLQRKQDDSFVNVLSGDPGISPNVNPEVTGADGKYQWDVSAGTYRVVVTKSGYDTVTSHAVNIPPPVTDLHIAMGEAGDHAPPNTTITSGPSGSTTDSTPTFGFSSSESGSTFECKRDALAFAPCASPFTFPLLANGGHTFQVRARDAADNVDPTPASRAFQVRPPSSSGGGDQGGGGQTGGGQTGSPAKPCAGLKGKKLARCKLDRKVKKTCGKLKGKKKRSICARRVRALAKCSVIKGKSKKAKRKKARCIRKAKAIGKRKH